jgi:hypothetical protein
MSGQRKVRWGGAVATITSYHRDHTLLGGTDGVFWNPIRYAYAGDGARNSC